MVNNVNLNDHRFIPTIDEVLQRPVSPQRKQEILRRLVWQAHQAELKQARRQWLENLSHEELVELAMKHMDTASMDF